MSETRKGRTFSEEHRRKLSESKKGDKNPMKKLETREKISEIVKKYWERKEMIVHDHLIVKIKFGSHLYGTNTKDSDLDLKGIYCPSLQQMLTGNVPKSIRFNTKSDSCTDKNSKEDIDCEYYSLQYFIKLACEGQTTALDMLHANNENILITSSIWQDLQRRRSKFYTKNLKAFIEYARKQAAKYGVKGSRLADMKKVIDYLEKYYTIPVRLEYIWDELPYEGEHIHFLTSSKNDNIRLYQVCGKKFQSTCTTEHMKNILKKCYDEYGHRAILAEENKGIDWKASSHALRACYQLLEIYETGDLKYPLKEANFLREVKLGKHSYKDKIGPLLDTLISEVERLASFVDLPESIDVKYWNNWIFNTLTSYYMITVRK